MDTDDHSPAFRPFVTSSLRRCVVLLPFVALLPFVLPASPLVPARAQEVTAIDVRSTVADWTVQFSDDFERAEPGLDWEVLSGDWRIRDGRLIGRGELLCAWQFPGAQRLEFEASAPDPGDLSGLIGVGSGGYKTGYFLGFGSHGNTCSKLLVAGLETQRVDLGATPGRTHHIRCERLGRRVTLTVDDHVVLDHEDPAPLTGPAHQRVGLYVWNQAVIDNVRISVRSDEPEPEPLSKEDFDDRAASDAWRPTATDGWTCGARGRAGLKLGTAYGRDGSMGLAAFRLDGDALNLLTWHTDIDQVANTLRLHVMLPDTQSGLDVSTRQGGDQLGVLRIGHGRGMRLVGADTTRSAMLLNDDALAPGRWYDIELQHDFVAQTQRARIDRGGWTPWLPLQQRGAGRADRVAFYCGTTRTGGASFCLDDVSTCAGRGVTPARPIVEDPNRVGNGGFERLMPGVRPRYPDDWLIERWDDGDRVELIDDPERAHAGRRFIRLTSRRADGVRLHNTPAGRAVRYEPGAAHEIRVHARAAAGEPVLWVEPGGLRVTPPSTWEAFVFRYEHAKDAAPPLGFFLAASGGAIDIDDVRVLPAGVEPLEAPEAHADRAGLRREPVDERWPPHCTERVPVEVSELMGADARAHRVTVPIQELFPALFHDFVATARARVIDAATGRAVPAVPFDSDGISGATAWDELVFLADVDARSTRTFHVCLTDRTPVPPDRRDLPAQLPASFRRDSGYEHALEVRVLDPQRRDVVEPAPANWKLEAVSALTLVRRDGPASIPGSGAPVARIAAAANEREPFQAVIGAVAALDGVTMDASDLVCASDGGRITADHIEVRRVVELDLPHATVGAGGQTGGYNAYPYHGLAGRHPDPLLPWRRHDVAAGTRMVAWVTVRVPRATPPGLYRGRLTATSANRGARLLPIELEVFGFELPDVRAFTPVLGADISMHMLQHADRLLYSPYTGRRHGRAEHERLILRNRANKTLVPGAFDGPPMELAVLFASRGISPFYYGSDYCPYAIPWRYDEQSRTAELDFERFDRVCDVLIGAHNLKHVFFGGRYYPAHSARAIYDGDYRPETWQHRTPNDQPRALDMRRAWSTAVRAHLQSKGWEDRAVVYITDEPVPAMDDLIHATARAWQEPFPALRTFAAASGMGGWRRYFDATDVFAGAVSHANRARMVARGIELWGPYNRPWLVSLPLANTRLIGLDSWRLGYAAYFHWAACRFNNVWLNTTYYRYTKHDTADYPGGMFVAGMFAAGMADLVVPWPADEPPAPDGRRYVATTMRFEQLCEGIDDFEYARLLERRAAALPPESTHRAEADALLAGLRAYIADANRGGNYTHKVPELGTFIIDPAEFERRRRAFGALIARLGV